MAYALQSMLKIRGMREDRAQTALAVARRARDVAERTLDDCRRKRLEYDQAKEPRRDRIYAAVLGRVVSRQDLDLAREAVVRIDEESMLLHQDEEHAAEAYRAKEREADEAHDAYATAAKEKAKIEEHRKLWEDEDRKQREMLEDAEMDEFTGRSMTADDDDTFD